MCRDLDVISLGGSFSNSRMSNQNPVVIFNVFFLGYALLVHFLSNSFLEQTVALGVREADSKTQQNATSSLLELTCDAGKINDLFSHIYIYISGSIWYPTSHQWLLMITCMYMHIMYSRRTDSSGLIILNVKDKCFLSLVWKHKSI